MTRTVDTLTDAEVAAHIEAKRHRPRKATARDIHSQRMKWAVEEQVAEAVHTERERCCAAICHYCNMEGWPVERWGNKWVHVQNGIVQACMAYPIREATP